jgi:hypothetical protein
MQLQLTVEQDGVPLWGTVSSVSERADYVKCEFSEAVSSF